MGLIAEDLGVVPDFLRASLAGLGVPGCKVLRWERDWHAPGQPFIDPADLRPLSAAMTGTHDTEPLAVWWDDVPTRPSARRFFALPDFGARGLTDPGSRGRPCSATRSSALAYRSASNESVPADAGRVRLARPDQHAGHGQRRTTGPGAAVARRPVLECPEAVERARFLRHLVESRRIG